MDKDEAKRLIDEIKEQTKAELAEIREKLARALNTLPKNNIDAVKSWFRSVLLWALVKRPEITKTLSKADKKRRSLERGQYGLLMTILAIGMAIASFFLNRNIVGLILPDPDLIEFFGLFIDPVVILAFSLTAAVAAAGVAAFDGQEIEELVSRVKKGTATHGFLTKHSLVQILLGVMLLTVAFLSSVRMSNLCGDVMSLKVIGVGFLTLICETTLAYTSSPSFRFFTSPVTLRIFDCLERNWSCVAVVTKILLALPVLILVLLLLLVCESAFAASALTFWLAYTLVCLHLSIRDYRICAKYWRVIRETEWEEETRVRQERRVVLDAEETKAREIAQARRIVAIWDKSQRVLAARGEKLEEMPPDIRRYLNSLPGKGG